MRSLNRRASGRCVRPLPGAFAAGLAGCLLALPAAGGPRRTAAEVLAGAGELGNPEVRRRAVEELGRIDGERRAEAEAQARRRGLPLRGSLPDGGGWELAGFEGEEPVYRTTLNAAAAISSGANRLWAAPYAEDGAGWTVGVWDEGSARITHQEFGGRVTSADGAGVSDHATHVTGTICAAGVDSNAVGMAPGAFVVVHDWTNDFSEMAAMGASYGGEPDKIYLSNHSYGTVAGWGYTETPSFTWYGSGTNASAVDPLFGKYNDVARDADALAHSLPYYLMFWAAGNDRYTGNVYNPVNGSTVALYPGGPTVIYDALLHPPSDGLYRGGYDTMNGAALAKNTIGVGSVTDATNGVTGLRDLAQARCNSWSSWGPADDGRIKPDLVANGYVLTSCKGASDASYGTFNGTSQASASAAGAAQLLASYYHRLFTNRWMLASTLKGLLIHTADDLDTPGPDYKVGWGLINAEAAAELIRATAASPGLRGLTEDAVGTNRAVAVVPFTWDGESPIRATLSWTDPAGEAETEGDVRSANLVNDLNLSVEAPGGSVFLPWVMPFVGDWGTNAYALAAVAGTNVTDNVEQVYIAAPAEAGVYRARVSFAGSLSGGTQAFSLIVSGATCSRATVLSVR